MAAALSATLGKLPRVFLPTGNCRFLSVSPCNLMKEIKHSEKDNHIIVEGVYVSGENKQMKAADTCRGGQVACHSFCKSPFVAQVKHTDVFILNQFVDSKGQMYSQEELEICHVSIYRIHIDNMILNVPQKDKLSIICEFVTAITALYVTMFICHNRVLNKSYTVIL